MTAIRLVEFRRRHSNLVGESAREGSFETRQLAMFHFVALAAHPVLQY